MARSPQDEIGVYCGSASRSPHGEERHGRILTTGIGPGNDVVSNHEGARDSNHVAGQSPYIFTPFSVKYFTAPGCHGIGEFDLIWFSTEKLFDS